MPELSQELDELCYILSDPMSYRDCISFIPLESIEIASDKRLQETLFTKYNIPRPPTYIIDSVDRVKLLIESNPDKRYIIKYPTACGSTGHYIVRGSFTEKPNWLKPFLVQQFIESDNPCVYRAYFVGGETIGSNVRRFAGKVKKDLVAHATGARYYYDDKIDLLGLSIAERALKATNLLSSFGVVDLIRDINGNWLVLEVGTDGIYNYVDREIDNNELVDRLHDRLAKTFLDRL